METSAYMNVSKVALVNEDFDEHSATEVPIFDELGNETSIPASIAYPNESYYVVKESEVLLPIVDATGLTVDGVQIDVSGIPYKYNVNGITYYHINEVYGGDRIVISGSQIFGEVDEDADGFFADVSPFHPPLRP